MEDYGQICYSSTLILILLTDPGSGSECPISILGGRTKEATDLTLGDSEDEGVY